MTWKKALFLLVACLVLFDCRSLEIRTSEPLTSSTIFMADAVSNTNIQFIWIEVPDPIKPGVLDVRMFLARADTPGPTIPNPGELRCISPEDKEYRWLGPERVPFSFNDDGSFNGSYTTRACPYCIECYMNWDTTLEFSGQVLPEALLLEIAVVHFGHNVQGSYLQTILPLVENDNMDPYMKCNRLMECEALQWLPSR